MTLLRVMLLVLAVVLAPQAAHAATGDAHAMDLAAAATAHADLSRDEVRADRLADCCEATTQPAPNCGVDLVALAGDAVGLGARGAARPYCVPSLLRDGVQPRAQLDPPRP